jgi:hypothetical protein
MSLNPGPSYRIYIQVEEKRENFLLRKLRKPGEREREKHFAFFLKFPIQKGRKLFSEKTEKTWRKRRLKGSATFLLHLVYISVKLRISKAACC